MLMTTQLEFEFKTKDGGSNVRKANILCTDTKNAINFIKKFGALVKISNIGFDNEVHAYTDEALDYILQKLNINKQDNELIKAENDKVFMEKENSYICPWCEKGFEKPMGLKMHINKMHMKKE